MKSFFHWRVELCWHRVTEPSEAAFECRKVTEQLPIGQPELLQHRVCHDVAHLEYTNGWQLGTRPSAVHRHRIQCIADAIARSICAY